MLIFTGEVMSSPCKTCKIADNGLCRFFLEETCSSKLYYKAQQSILSQCREVDWNALKNAYDDYIDNGHYIISKTFKEYVEDNYEQFIQEQEGKDIVC